MPAAVILICSTLVTNAATGTTAAIECPTPSQAEVADLSNSFENFSFLTDDHVIVPVAAPVGKPKSAEAAPAAVPASSPAPAKAKPVFVAHKIYRPKHISVAYNAPRRHHATWHRTHVTATSTAEVRPDAPPSLWDKIKSLHVFGLGQNGD